MNNLIPTREEIEALFSGPDTWAQIHIILFGAVTTWLLGRYLRSRLEPMTLPGVFLGFRRTAVRTTAIALIPALFWLWLLIGKAYFRRHDLETHLLQPAMWLVGAAALVRAGVFVLRHSFSPGSRLKAWEGALTVTIWTILALHILGWLPIVEEILDEHAVVFGKLRISLYNAVSFALLTGLLLLAALWISNALRARVAKSAVLDESMKFALGKLATFALATLAVITSMVAAGIDLTAFAVFGGALGVGLGLGLQRVVSNFVSGFILAFEGSIRVGYRITFGDERGRVTALHARHIVVRTDDGLFILVPNENLLTAAITNWSYADENELRVHVMVQISYADDPEHAIALMTAAAREHPLVTQPPEPSVIVTELAENGIALELRCWIKDVDHGIRGVRSDLLRRIWREFKESGITVPYPQRDIHLSRSGSRDLPEK
jgi:small-conductance mechanosensitive channel